VDRKRQGSEDGGERTEKRIEEIGDREGARGRRAEYGRLGF